MELKHNKDLLYDLYISNEYSMSKIAAMYGVSTMTIRAWLIKNDIKPRLSTQTVYEELKTTSLTAKQNDLIIGSLLGDGSITIGRDCKNARFIERHCEAQKEYLIWKRDLLKPFTKSKLSIKDSDSHIISGVGCKVQKSYMFSTISHPSLTDFRDLFYRDGVKVVPSNLELLLNDFSFMVWLCDDGCLTFNKKNGIYRLDLHTESFTLDENMFLCRLLQKKYNSKFRINSRKYKSGKAYYICLSGRKNLLDIVSTIKKDIPECMLNKFRYYLT